VPRITTFCICIYVFGCRLSLFRLCDSDFGIIPVAEITIGTTFTASCFHTSRISFASSWYLFYYYYHHHHHHHHHHYNVFSGSSQPCVSIVSLIMIMLLTRILLNFWSFIHCTTEYFYLDALFFIYVYSGLKCCPSLLDTTCIRVLSRNFINSSMFTATCKNCPSARCVPAVNRECKVIDIHRNPIISLTEILRYSVTFLNHLRFFRV
jgi:hypothetical protein